MQQGNAAAQSVAAAVGAIDAVVAVEATGSAAVLALETGADAAAGRLPTRFRSAGRI
ncbi:MAG: hypothetical protein WB995_07760 [Candidatus Acidiferrales bacterium]